MPDQGRRARTAGAVEQGPRLCHACHAHAHDTAACGDAFVVERAVGHPHGHIGQHVRIDIGAGPIVAPGGGLLCLADDDA